MNGKPKDDFSGLHNLSRARDCGIYSHLDSNDDMQFNSSSCTPVIITASNNIANRIALRLKYLEEERAIQRREREAEARAIAREKIALQRKYALLEEQISLRRN